MDLAIVLLILFQLFNFMMRDEVLLEVNTQYFVEIFYFNTLIGSISLL